jgi:hypothetical protein
MSSISINGGDQGLAQFFQKLSSSTASPNVAATVAPTAAASVAVSDTTTSDDKGVQGAGGHHHGHGGLFKKVEAAVTTALEAAKSDPNADPNKVVEDAIAKVFKDSGVTPPTGADASAGVKSATDPDGDGNQDPAGKADSEVSAARQAFTQTLQAFGVSASQFHTDFLAAIKDAQGGASDAGDSLFKTFPPGSSVDTTA